MRYQDQLVKDTQKALNDFIRAVEALPADRLEWTPSETSRSAMSMYREVAMTSNFYARFLNEQGEPHDPHDPALGEAQAVALDTKEKCRAAAELGNSEVIRIMIDFPDEGLEREVVLPFLNDTAMTMADVLGLYAWNLVYHCGQVNYIQTIFGDREMH